MLNARALFLLSSHPNYRSGSLGARAPYFLFQWMLSSPSHLRVWSAADPLVLSERYNASPSIIKGWIKALSLDGSDNPSYDQMILERGPKVSGLMTSDGKKRSVWSYRIRPGMWATVEEIGRMEREVEEMVQREQMLARELA